MLEANINALSGIRTRDTSERPQNEALNLSTTDRLHLPNTIPHVSCYIYDNKERQLQLDIFLKLPAVMDRLLPSV